MSSSGGAVREMFSGFGADLLTSGQETISRLFATTNLTGAASGVVRFGMFTARRAETVGNIAQCTSSAAAVGLTLARMGLYSVDAGGNLALLSACSSDLSLFVATFTTYSRALSSPVPLVVGQRYAIANLQVGATSSGLAGNNNLLPGSEMLLPPMLSAGLAAQADLPAAVAVGALSNGSALYGRVFP